MNGVDTKLRATLDGLWSQLAEGVPSGNPSSLLSTEVFLRTVAGAVRVALDTSGRRHLLLPVKATSKVTVEPGGSGGVAVAARELMVDDIPTAFVDLVCERSDLNGVFTGLAADICTRLADGSSDPHKVVARALTEWRELLGLNRQQWTRSLLAGLFGELVVLRDLLELESSAGELWTGPYGAAHDFHSAHDALEVKTTTQLSGRVVRIHGVDQLERPHGGTLSLAWIRVVESPSGSTVGSAIDSCLGLAADPDVLVRALDQLSLPPADHHLVRETFFEVIERRWYSVTEGFPRVTPEMFATGAVPGGVAAIEYSLDLDAVGDWTGGGPVLQALTADR